MCLQQFLCFLQRCYTSILWFLLGKKKRSKVRVSHSKIISFPFKWISLPHSITVSVLTLFRAIIIIRSVTGILSMLQNIRADSISVTPGEYSEPSSLSNQLLAFFQCCRISEQIASQLHQVSVQSHHHYQNQLLPFFQCCRISEQIASQLHQVSVQSHHHYQISYWHSFNAAEYQSR